MKHAHSCCGTAGVCAAGRRVLWVLQTQACYTTYLLQKRGGQAVVGVTTGQLFCAMVGSRRRSEYTAFGDAINLAARLMVKAKEGQLGPVLCDANTQHQAQGKVGAGQVVRTMSKS